MKKYLLAFLTLVFLSSSVVFAESATELCTAEAKDAGIEDEAEFRNYVNNCVEQITADEQSSQENSSAQPSDKE